MIDSMIRELEASPGNKALALNVAQLMARQGRDKELVEPLLDLGKWNKASEAAKLCASYEVFRRFEVEGNGRFRLEGLRDWSCVVQARSPKNPQQNWVKSYTVSLRLATFKHLATGIDFQLLPGSETKEMWCPSCGKEGLGDHCPNCDRRRLSQSIKPFLIARFPVTNAQAWRTHPRNGTGDSLGMYDGAEEWEEDLPAEGSSFDEVSEYAEDNGFDIPTKGQWEYACRAGTHTSFFWGADFDPSYVWYAGNSGASKCFRDYQTGGSVVVESGEHGNITPRPHSPKEHDSAGKWNAFGLVDCIGNVWEWCKSGSISGGSYNLDRIDGPHSFGNIVGWTNGGNGQDVGFRPAIALPRLGE